jgi:regulatory protein
MAICAGSEHSGGDIRYKLSSWGVNSSDADEIIGILKKENFINDKRFAAAYTADKIRNNKWGKIKISSQLRLKGIPDEIIRSSLDEVDGEQYSGMIKEVLASYRKTVKAKNKYDLKGKLMRFGLSRGYESHLLYDILGDLE